MSFCWRSVRTASGGAAATVVVVVVANLASSPTHVDFGRRLARIGGGGGRRVVNSWRRIVDESWRRIIDGRGDSERDKKRGDRGRATREHFAARRRV